MRAGAEGDAFRCIAGDVETVRIAKASLVAIGRAEHEEHAILRLEIDAAERPMSCDAARRHPDRPDPARIFLEHVEPFRLAFTHHRYLIGMRHQRPDRADAPATPLLLPSATPHLNLGPHPLHRLAPP